MSLENKNRTPSSRSEELKLNPNSAIEKAFGS